MRTFLLGCFLLVMSFVAHGQQPGKAVQDIEDAPTKEIYDLMVDKRGFLWLATSLGIYRYDGIEFTPFSHPAQSSISALSVLEDDKGRIWYTNYNGQIFYIENETPYLLTDYLYKNETRFPRLVMFNHQLMCTTDKGLFIINTTTLKGHYIKSRENPLLGTGSFTVSGNTLVGYHEGQWSAYRPGTGLKPLKFVGTLNHLKQTSSSLSPKTFHDTIYLTSNPASIVGKLILRGDSLVQVGEYHSNSFINTISINDNDQWINTINTSFAIKGGQRIDGQSLTAIVTDHEGNRWFSSTKLGLKVQYAKTPLNKLDVSLLTKSGKMDYPISCINRYQDNLIIGTPNGLLLLFDPVKKQIIKQYKLPENIGSIVYIVRINTNEYIIGCSINTYRLNAQTGRAKRIGVIALKGMAVNPDITALASTSGLVLIPADTSDASINKLKQRFEKTFTYDPTEKFFKLQKRCGSVAFYPEHHSVLANFKDGVYEIDSSGAKPILYGGKHLYVSSMTSINNTVYFGPITGGLLILNNKGYRHVSVTEGLTVDVIFHMKHIGNHLWLNSSGLVQLYNLGTNKVSKAYNLPSRLELNTTDVEEINGHIYFSTFNGLMELPNVPFNGGHNFANYMLSVKVGDSIVPANFHDFPHTANKIQLKIGVPSYSHSKNIYIKYTLVSQGDTVWHATPPGQRNIDLSFLLPGHYTFTAVAFSPKYGFAANPVKYSFTISHPWWQQAWFKIIVFMAIVMVVVSIIASYDVKQRNFKRALQKKEESIRSERNRISSEIHDDIGSSLFAIKLFAENAARKRNDINEIVQINDKINEMSGKIREIIWSTNIENDNLENLLYHIQAQTSLMFKHSHIRFSSTMPDDIPNVTINSITRKNIYLLVKEFVHNAMKHSHGTKVSLNIELTDTEMVFVVADNGQGIKVNDSKLNGMGMHNVRSRIALLRGQLNIENNNGTIVTMKIPYAEKQYSWFSLLKSKLIKV